MSALFLAVAASLCALRRPPPPSNTIHVANAGEVRSDSVVVGPVASLNVALMSDGVDAWPDLMGSQLRSPPIFLELLPLTIPQWQVPVGVDVEFTCPNTAAVQDVCEAWVFFYSCPLACAAKYQGGVPGLLEVTPGWERSRCAPHMVTGVAGTSFVHPMAGFRKQLARGESTTITIPGAEKAEFLVFGIDALAVDCTQHMTAGPCQAVLDGRCKWDAVAQRCHAQDCKAQTGPWPHAPRPAAVCPECPWQGLEMRPAGDGPFAGP